MSKYSSLRDHLRSRGTSEIAMSFSDIERIVGHPLPASAHRHRAWWSNNTSNNVMTKAWVDAGYCTAQVDLAEERLIFRRVDSVQLHERPQLQKRHPLFGALKGMMRIEPGTDLAAPAGEEWDAATS